MTFVLAATRKDLIRLLRDPYAMLVWLSIPVILVGLMSVMFGSGRSAGPQGSLLIADLDGSLLSQFVAGAFSQGQLGQMFRVQQVGVKQGRERMDDGRDSALLVLPKGFGNAVLLNHPTKLELIVNPSQRILPRIVQETLEVLIDGSFYVQRVAGDQVRAIVQGPPDGAPVFSDQAVSQVSVAINSIVQTALPYTNPPRIDVRVTKTEPQNQPVNFAQVMAPGALFMAILFFSQSQAADLWRERTLGTLRRLATTPASLAWFLGGKLLAVVCAMALISLAGIFVTSWLLGASFRNPLVAALWTTIAGAAFYTWMAVVQTVASSTRGANLLSSLLVFPLVMLGGSFFPFEAMPAFLARIGRWTPNGMALVKMRGILDGSLATGDLLIAVVWAAVLIAAGFLLTVRRLRSGFFL